MRLVFIIVLLALTITAPAAAWAPAASAPATPQIDGFGPIGPAAGWLLAENRLFVTPDKGQTWQDVTPAGDAARLLAADFFGAAGWLITGSAAASPDAPLTLARTSDTGATWRSVPLALPPHDDAGLPIAGVQMDFQNQRVGRLRLIYASSSNFERYSDWSTEDGGETWARLDGTSEAASSAPGALPDVVFLPDGRNGWRLQQAGECTVSGSTRVCEQHVRLSVTHDGGQSWRPIALPAGVSSSARSTVPDGPALNAATASAGQRTIIAAGHGFDKCEVPTLDQLREWRRTSPYSSVNLYIGGALRACSNRALSASYLRSIYDDGWTFIPTWVGPQAPCTSFRSRISYDPSAAQGQGLAEANAAADTLAALGLAEPGGGGSIAYYDMEAYASGDSACNAAVQAFVLGWNQGMHARGHLAGVYGLGWTLSLLANLSQPPDAVWPAHWIRTSYDSGVTVWDVRNLDDKLWANHQRLRQYTGGHNETWGGVTLNIDANVLDGPVALAGPGPDTPTPTATVTPTRTPFPFTPRAWFYLPMITHP